MHQIGDQLAEKDNQRKAVEKALAKAHSVRLVRRFLELYSHWQLQPLVSGPEHRSKPLSRPFEAKAATLAVPHQEQSNAVEDVQSLPVEPAPTTHVDESSPHSLAIVPQLVATVQPPVNRTELPFTEMDWAGRVNPSQVLHAWMSLQPVPVSSSDRNRFSKSCKAIAADHTAGEIALAFVGMRYLWPFAPPPIGKNEPWTPEELKKHFVKATSAAGQHPSIAAARRDQDFMDAVERIAREGGTW
jgi:hypothetical protein